MKNIVNEISLVYKPRICGVGKINTSLDSAIVAREFLKKAKCQISLKEYFFIILLNRGNQVIGYHKLSEGGIAGTYADVRLVFATALKSVASGVILVHNHPSGNRSASFADKCLTKKFCDAGRILDVEVLDHIILTEKEYYSFADDGALK